MWWRKLGEVEKSAPCIILAFIPCLGQKLSKLVEIWRSSEKNNFAQFFETWWTYSETADANTDILQVVERVEWHVMFVGNSTTIDTRRQANRTVFLIIIIIIIVVVVTLTILVLYNNTAWQLTNCQYQCLRKAKVVTFPKYRPISLTCLPSRILERITVNRILDHLYFNAILCDV